MNRTRKLLVAILAVALIAAALLMSGCESDAAKLKRLETDRLISCLAAQGAERAGDFNSEYRTECTLAARALNRFMGR